MDKNVIREQVLNSIDMTRDPEDDELHNIIDSIILSESDYKYITIEDRVKLHSQIFN